MRIVVLSLAIIILAIPKINSAPIGLTFQSDNTIHALHARGFTIELPSNLIEDVEQQLLGALSRKQWTKMHPGTGADPHYTAKERKKLVGMAKNHLPNLIESTEKGPTTWQVDDAMTMAKHRLDSIEQAMHIVDVAENPGYLSSAWIQPPENSFVREKTSYRPEWVAAHPDLPLY
ncbi:hypothetical protein FRB98_004585 [Tulasnella sp. 332]|nr:hypothetical protein FRB98_004585 [Tulasnella sp. 332]